MSPSDFFHVVGVFWAQYRAFLLVATCGILLLWGLPKLYCIWENSMKRG